MTDARQTVATDGKTSPATIYDVARLAGVSASTVSRALNKPGRLNAATEAKVRAAAQSLGYQLNPMARALLTGQTRTVGLILADITNPVFATLVRGAESAASEEGYLTIIAESQESGDREFDTAQRLIPATDGIVLVSTRMSDENIRALADRKPLVVVNRAVDGVASIVPDPRPGITAALLHLHAQGHRSIAYLSGPPSSFMNRLRWEGVFDECVARGMTVVDIGPAAPDRSGGRELFDRVLASGVTAVLTYNDLMAIGLLQESHERGVDVPGRLSIVGFDDSFGADFTTPALTTIRSPLHRLGELAFLRLIRQQPSAADRTEPLITELIQRASTAPPVS